MTAYIVFTRDETTDAAELALYSQAVGASFEGHTVEFLATYGDIETLEGSPVEAAVILRFPDMQAARAWYHSPAYQAVARHRFKGAKFRAILTEGRGAERKEAT